MACQRLARPAHPPPLDLETRGTPHPSPSICTETAGTSRGTLAGVTAIDPAAQVMNGVPLGTETEPNRLSLNPAATHGGHGTYAVQVSHLSYSVADRGPHITGALTAVHFAPPW